MKGGRHKVAYPSSLDTFGTPAGTSTLSNPDHALEHRTLGSAVGTLEQVLGTTGGTAVLKNFSAGKFAVYDNGGTLNNAIVGTPRITGGTASSFLMGTSRMQGGTVANAIVGTSTVQGGTVANAVVGTSSIVGGTAQAYQSKTHTLGSVAVSGTVSTTQNFDLSAASRFLLNMPNSAGSITLTVSNVTANQPFLIEIMQGTAGLGTINWFSTIRWAGSAAPTQTLTGSRKDTFGFIATGTNTFDGYIVGQNL